MFDKSKFRKMMFAMDSDKKKAGQPMQPIGMSPAPMSNLKPQNNGIAPIPKLKTPSDPMNPVGIPAEPGLGKLPKFGKMKNSLKGQFKIK